MNPKRTALFLLCLWLLNMACVARRDLDYIDLNEVPPLLRWTMSAFWLVQVLLVVADVFASRRGLVKSLCVIAIGEALLWQAAVTAHVSAMSMAHTRWWINGVEAPSHMNPNPPKTEK